MKLGTSIFLFILYLDHQTNSSKQLFKIVHRRFTKMTTEKLRYLELCHFTLARQYRQIRHNS